MKKKKIFRLTAKELKVLRAGKQTAGSAGPCNGASWASSAERVGPKRPPVKATPKPAIKK